MYDAILVPTDGSDCADTALDHAIGLASDYDATIHALYVVDEPQGEDVAVADLRETLRERGEDVVEAVAERVRSRGVDVETAVLGGAPSSTIVEYAGGHDVDLIVMGTHGRRDGAHALLGSVTERVVRTSEIPVLTIRGE